MTPEEQDKALEKERDQQIRLIYKLSQMQEFQLWRDLVCKPQLELLERSLEKSDDIPEAELRAKVKHLNSLKYYFHRVFTDIQASAQFDKDAIEIKS
ncbi:MAG: hypothetical protein ACYDBV_14965 [Nitrospiria bacterium]